MRVPLTDWSAVRAVVFDVDGTLYAQRPLRMVMLRAMLSHYLLRPHRIMELYWLYHFRRHREALAERPHEGLERLQYSAVAARFRVEEHRVRSVVERWIYRAPLRHLAACRYRGVEGFLARLRDMGITVAFLSDYPAAEKLAAMGMRSENAYSATDPSIDRLKPSPRGLQVIMADLGLRPGQCLMIGDRPERDGACAAAAGVPYRILGKGEADFYLRLAGELDGL